MLTGRCSNMPRPNQKSSRRLMELGLSLLLQKKKVCCSLLSALPVREERGKKKEERVRRECTTPSSCTPSRTQTLRQCWPRTAQQGSIYSKFTRSRDLRATFCCFFHATRISGISSANSTNDSKGGSYRPWQ